MTRRRWLLVAGAAALVIALAGIPLYVLPDRGQPAPVDVIYVIGPPTDARMDVARGMVADGLARTVMVSLDPEEANEYPDAARACAGEWDATTVICAKPDPFTTRGEARELESEMAAHGWDTAAVITFTPHVTRTRMIMERCETGDVAVIDSGEALAPHYWVYHYAYQTAGFAKAFVLHGC